MSTVQKLERIIRTGTEEDELEFRARHPHAAYDHDVKQSLSGHERAAWEYTSKHLATREVFTDPGVKAADTYAPDPVVAS